jgi:hypothetical protein
MLVAPFFVVVKMLRQALFYFKNKLFSRGGSKHFKSLT